MLPTNDTGHADLLNCIVTITDLLSNNDRSLDSLGKLTESIARLKGLLSTTPDITESFAESGGFESLLKALEATTITEHDTNAESQADDATVVQSGSISDDEDNGDDKAQLQKELLQLTFAALSQALASSPKSKEAFLQIDGYNQIDKALRFSRINS